MRDFYRLVTPLDACCTLSGMVGALVVNNDSQNVPSGEYLVGVIHAPRPVRVTAEFCLQKLKATLSNTKDRFLDSTKLKRGCRNARGSP